MLTPHAPIVPRSKPLLLPPFRPIHRNPTNTSQYYTDSDSDVEEDSYSALEGFDERGLCMRCVARAQPAEESEGQASSEPKTGYVLGAGLVVLAFSVVYMLLSEK
jgi:hypothetical protein